MELNNRGLEDDVPFQLVDFLGSMWICQDEHQKKHQTTGDWWWERRTARFFLAGDSFLSFKQPTCSSQLLGIYVETETLRPDKWRSPVTEPKKTLGPPLRKRDVFVATKRQKISPNFPSYPVEHLEMGNHVSTYGECIGTSFSIGTIYWVVPPSQW